MSKAVIPIERIARAILMLGDQRVMLDDDLAMLCGVETRALAVRRNPDGFPNDFMFELSEQEIDTVVSQFVIRDLRRFGGAKPMAFTEQGIAMLSSILNNERAIKVNIAIMRAFVKLRQMLETNCELAGKFSVLEQRVDKHDEEIAAILEAIRQLMALPETARSEIGFHVLEKVPRYRVRKCA